MAKKNASPSSTADAKAKAAHVWNRDALDWYVEGERVTDQLLTVERFTGVVWDPCCGQGNIVRALLRAGHDAVGTDVAYRAGQDPGWFHGLQDFLYGDHLPTPIAPNIVFNPPFFKAKGAELAIRRAIAISTGKVAAFVNAKFLTSSGRAAGLFKEFPPSRVWHITPRPSCPPGDFLLDGGVAQGGVEDFVWIVWDRTSPATGPYQGGWLTALPVDGPNDSRDVCGEKAAVGHLPGPTASRPAPEEEGALMSRRALAIREPALSLDIGLPTPDATPEEAL